MKKHKACFTAALAVLLAAAVPLSAQAQRLNNPGGVAARGAVHAMPNISHPAPHFSVAPHFSGAPHFSVPSFTPHITRSTPRFTPHLTPLAPRLTPYYARPARRYTPRITTHRQVVHRTRHFTPRVTTHRQVVHQTPHVRTLNRAATRVHHAPTVTGTVGMHSAQPNLQEQRHVAAHRSGHRIRTAHVTPQAARQGRFASSFTTARMRAATSRIRSDYVAARRAWRDHRRAAFVAWYGPVYWPYAYSDIFDYAFWPDGYDDGYWYYAYDDFFDGVFWGESGPPEEYVYAPASGGPSYVASEPRVTYAGVEELCKEPGTGITAWPFAEIERKVGLDADQKHSLNDVREAAKKAAATFKASCPSGQAFPLTPPRRLQAMTARLSATLEAVDIVRPPLTQFYNSLSDEQKARFNQLGPNRSAVNAEARAALPDEARSCKQAKPGLTNLPIEEIDGVVKPTDTQAADLDKLQDAVGKAVSILQAACPQEMPLTPPGRLDAMHTRLKAMIDAANTVKPALDAFYGSLSNEQKARFNRLGRELAQTSSNY